MATMEVRQSELKRIYERDGYVTASGVVKEATPKKSPIHDEFEWNDQVAAHEHRLDQARRMIKRTVIRDKTGVEEKFYHIPPTKVEGPTAQIQQSEGVYKPVREVVKAPSDYQKALRALYVHRNAMDRAIRDLKRAAKDEGKEPDLLPQLEDGLKIVKTTLRLMMQQAA